LKMENGKLIVKKNIIKEKSFAFALRIVKLNRFLSEEKREFVLSKPLKEANETDYWVELLYQAKIIDKTGFESIKPDITELLKLLTSIIKSSKSRVDIK